MEKKILLALGFSGFLFSSMVSADGILTEPVSQWRGVVGIGGGVAVTTNLGQSQTFPILNPISDEYYIYSRSNASQTAGLFEGFIGGEHTLYSKWLVQTGLAYAQAGSYHPRGSFIQGTDPQSADVYNYQYSVMTRQIMAQTKLMYAYHEKYYPYVLIGLGGSFNRSSNYVTNVPSFLTFTRQYQNHTTDAFAYRVGAGFDVDILNHVRLGLAYRFSDLGSVSLGSATINQIPVYGKLNQSNLYANEVLAQLTYVI